MTPTTWRRYTVQTNTNYLATATPTTDHHAGWTKSRTIKLDLIRYDTYKGCYCGPQTPHIFPLLDTSDPIGYRLLTEVTLFLNTNPITNTPEAPQRYRNYSQPKAFIDRTKIDTPIADNHI